VKLHTDAQGAVSMIIIDTVQSIAWVLRSEDISSYLELILCQYRHPKYCHTKCPEMQSHLNM
jgi:hypothetical protein